MAVQLETHELSSIEDLDVKVVVWDSGTVDIWIGKEMLTVENLGAIVGFVEDHGQVKVVSE